MGLTGAWVWTEMRDVARGRQQFKNATADDLLASLETLLQDAYRALVTGELSEDNAAGFRDVQSSKS